jgi:hypothetical protein
MKLSMVAVCAISICAIFGSLQYIIRNEPIVLQADNKNKVFCLRLGSAGDFLISIFHQFGDVTVHYLLLHVEH